MGVNDKMRTCDLIDLFDGPPLVHHGVPYTKTRSVEQRHKRLRLQPITRVA